MENIKQDKLIRGLVANGSVKLMAIDGKNFCERARSIHGLSRVCTAALSRTMLAAAMMGSELKGANDKLTVIIKGGGPAGNIVVCAKPDCAVKGYIENPALELPPTPEGKLDVSMAVGWFGELTVVRDLGMKEPYVGKVQMVSGEIAEDFAQYFAVSEQQPSLVYLGVRVDKETGVVLAAGGLILQPMPGCPEEELDALTGRAEAIKELSIMLERGMELEDAVKLLFSGMDTDMAVFAEPKFQCDCSRERLEGVLLAMGRSELEDMIKEDHGAKLTCHFCNTEYAFAEEELKDLLAAALKDGESKN